MLVSQFMRFHVLIPHNATLSVDYMEMRIYNLNILCVQCCRLSSRVSSGPKMLLTLFQNRARDCPSRPLMDINKAR